MQPEMFAEHPTANYKPFSSRLARKTLCYNPNPREDPKSRTPNAGFENSSGPDYGTLRWRVLGTRLNPIWSRIVGIVDNTSALKFTYLASGLVWESRYVDKTYFGA